MNNEQQANSAGGAPVGYQSCLCREAIDSLRKLFTPSPAVAQHLLNSRIEFLKAIQTLINERVEQLSGAREPGTKIPVE